MRCRRGLKGMGVWVLGVVTLFGILVQEEIQAVRVGPACSKGAMLAGNREGEISLFGGLFEPGVALKDLWTYRSPGGSLFNPNTAHWFETRYSSKTSPLARWKGTLTFGDDGFAYLFGGSSPIFRTNKEEFLNDVWRLTLSSGEWKQLISSNPDNPIQPRPRRAHTTVLYKRNLVIFGGKDENNTLLSDTWLFNLDTNQFTLLKNTRFPDVARKGHTAVVYQDGMYTYGGRRGDSYFGAIYRLDLVKYQWENITFSSGPSPRNHHIAEVVYLMSNKSELSASMLIFGGRDEHESLKSYDELWSFDLSTHLWKMIPRKDASSPWPNPRIEAASAHYGRSAFYLIGGESPSGQYLNDLWIYNAQIQEWVNIEENDCDDKIPGSIKIFSILVMLFVTVTLIWTIIVRFRSRNTGYQNIA